MLLEIGRWKTVRNCIANIDQMAPADAAQKLREPAAAQSLDCYDNHNSPVLELTRCLCSFVGQIYGNFVKQCLDMSADDFSLKLGRELVEKFRSCNV